ncbi:MAG: hypothetical protein KDJ52_15555 [Anaerolineae bacterium]|nr:hypothetical protein [Anaerolineae bacterium]
MAKLTIPLEGKEQEALSILAQMEKRDVRMQAALMLRQSLEKLGLLQPIRLTENEARNEPSR